MTSSSPQISAVIPVFNEVESLPALKERMTRVLTDLGQSYELILVDDGSSDGSETLLEQYQRETPEIRVIRLDRNWGLTAALDAGFQSARGEIIVTLDADLQTEPEEIPLLLEKLDEYDLICGWRREREDPWLKRASSRVANGFRNYLSHDSVHDTCCPMKVFRRSILDRIRLYDGLHRFIPTLAKWEGFRVTEVPVRHHRRLHGKSKYGVWNRLFKGLGDLRTVRWMRKNRLRYKKQILD